jgi:hypothetical protein
MTDSFGAYIIDGLPDGEYTIRSSARGAYPSARISARAGVNYADLVITRNSPTVLSGQVVSDTGETLEGVTVVPTTLGQASVMTNDFGRFRVPVSLAPAVTEVALRFQRPGYREQVARVPLRPETHAQTNELTVIMPPVESWTSLHGTIASQSGESLAGRTIELRPRSTKLAYTATTDSDGEYEFPVVESPAEYRLIVFGGAGYKDYQQSLRITEHTSRLDVVVEPYEFGEVSGQLVNVHGEPVPEFDLVLRNTASRRPNTIVTTNEFGSFEVPAVPAGELVVASQSTPSILVQGLQLAAGESLHLPLVLDWGEHEIRGIVVDSRGNPVPASRILLQWSHRAGGITTRATRRTASDTQGQFAFSNLGPGPHSLQVDAQGFPSVDLEHDLSRQGYDLTVRLN